MKNISWLLLLGIFALSCQDQDIAPNEDLESSLNANKHIISTQKTSKTSRDTSNDCGEVTSFTLWAGQHMDAGSVEVSNNETTLFVTYNASGDWTISETHLYIGSTPPQTKNGSLKIGHFPYKGEHDNVVSVTYEIDMAGLDECFDIYAHAVVNETDDSGNVNSQTAFGGDQEGDVSRWYYYGSYCIQECEDDECVPSDETGWSAGDLYSEDGSWATYSVYIDPEKGYGEAKYEILYAGQNIEAGTVTFSDSYYNPNTSVGEVTISISLNDCWEFRGVAENVKVQGYDNAPSGNPSPGNFQYKYDAESGYIDFTIRERAYYGIHVDLTGGCCE